MLNQTISLNKVFSPDYTLSQASPVADKRMFELRARNEEKLLGKPIFEELPEMKEQDFEGLLQYVFSKGERYTAHGNTL